MKLPTLAQVRERLRYDPEAGRLYWKEAHGSRAPAGSQAGHINAEGYRQISVCGQRVMAHRIVWALETGEWPTTQLDHRDLDKDNNRFGNLRPCTQTQNAGNTPKTARNTSGFKGVSRTSSGRFRADIGQDGKVRLLGTFDTPEEAHAVYCAAATAKYGEFARFA